MTQITVDKVLIEQALEALACAYISNPTLAALRDALAEPVVEPVAYRSLLASGNYTYCDTDVFLDNAEPLYTAPPPPAEVPMLTDYEIRTIFLAYTGANAHGFPYLTAYLENGAHLMRQVEALVRQEAGLV